MEDQPFATQTTAWRFSEPEYSEGTGMLIVAEGFSSSRDRYSAIAKGAWKVLAVYAVFTAIMVAPFARSVTPLTALLIFAPILFGGGILLLQSYSLRSLLTLSPPEKEEPIWKRVTFSEAGVTVASNRSIVQYAWPEFHRIDVGDDRTLILKLSGNFDVLRFNRSLLVPLHFFLDEYEYGVAWQMAQRALKAARKAESFPAFPAPVASVPTGGENALVAHGTLAWREVYRAFLYRPGWKVWLNFADTFFGWAGFIATSVWIAFIPNAPLLIYFALPFFFLVITSNGWMLHHAYRRLQRWYQRRFAAAQLHWIITDRELNCSSDAFSITQRWNDVERTRLEGDVLYLFFSKRKFFVLARRFFAEEKHWRLTVELAAQATKSEANL